MAGPLDQLLAALRYLIPNTQGVGSQNIGAPDLAAMGTLGGMAPAVPNSTPGGNQWPQPPAQAVPAVSPGGTAWPSMAPAAGLPATMPAKDFQDLISRSPPPPSLTAGAMTQPDGAADPELPKSGEVPLPKPRPKASSASLMAEDGDTEDNALPDNATTTQGAQTPAMAALQEQPSIFNRIGQGLTANAPMLMALGAGLAGAPTIGTGLSRGFANAAPIALANQKQQLSQSQINQTAQALLAKGVPPTDVIAAVNNPDIMKALVSQQFQDKALQFTTVKDALGQETVEARDKYTGKLVNIGGDAGTSDSGGAASGPTGKMSLMAQGKKYDPNLVGEDYKAQFAPEIQTAMDNYIAGKTQPTGRSGMVQIIKQLAGKYAADTNQQADDTTYAARRTMRTDLARDTPQSVGGKIEIGNTALGHLADMAKAGRDLGNWDVGLTGPSHLINSVRGWSTSQSPKIKALQDAAGHYGQEITKFYAGSPGGEAERERFLHEVDGAATPGELAAVVEKESQLMHDKLSSIEGHITATLGPQGNADYPIIRKNGKASLEDLTKTIAQLRGSGLAAQSGVLSGKTSGGLNWSVVPGG